MWIKGYTMLYNLPAYLGFFRITKKQLFIHLYFQRQLLVFIALGYNIKATPIGSNAIIFNNITTFVEYL